jgi:hypothetical protein
LIPESLKVHVAGGTLARGSSPRVRATLSTTKAFTWYFTPNR